MITTYDLVRAAARVTGIDAKSLVSPDRRNHVVQIRTAISIAARRIGRSTTQIGRALNRDHSTIICNIKRRGMQNSTCALAADIERAVDANRTVQNFSRRSMGLSHARSATEI